MDGEKQSRGKLSAVRGHRPGSNPRGFVHVGFNCLIIVNFDECGAQNAMNGSIEWRRIGRGGLGGAAEIVFCEGKTFLHAETRGRNPEGQRCKGD